MKFSIAIFPNASRVRTKHLYNVHIGETREREMATSAENPRRDSFFRYDKLLNAFMLPVNLSILESIHLKPTIADFSLLLHLTFSPETIRMVLFLLQTALF